MSLPRGGWLGVRPLLENSTACQKSMPNYTSSAGWLGWLVLRGWWLGCLVGDSFG